MSKPAYLNSLHKKDLLKYYCPGTLLGRLATWLAPSAETPKEPYQNPILSPEDDPETIHIFTIASGHMYERLQKIMVLSVLRNTRRVSSLM